MTMQYKQAAKATFAWPVKVPVATDGGQFEERTINALFRRLPTTEVEQIQKQFEQDGDQLSMLRQLVAGWVDQDVILDANDQPAAFCAEAFEYILTVPGVAVALMSEYSAAFNGGLRRKT